MPASVVFRYWTRLQSEAGSNLAFVRVLLYIATVHMESVESVGIEENLLGMGIAENVLHFSVKDSFIVRFH